MLQILSLSVALFTTPAQNILNPRIELIAHDSALTQCLTLALKNQAPPKTFGEGEVYFAGPNERRDYQPPHSAYEILVTIPNSKPYPRYLTLSVMLESVDRQAWQKEDLAGGGFAISADAMINPVNIFSRAQMQHLFDLDVSACIK